MEVEGQRKKGRQKRTWKRQVVEESVEVGLRREDTPLCHSKWSVGLNNIAVGLRSIWPPSHVADTTRLQTLVSLSLIAHTHTHTD